MTQTELRRIRVIQKYVT